MPAQQKNKGPDDDTAVEIDRNFSIRMRACFKAPDWSACVEVQNLQTTSCRWPYDGPEGELVRYCGIRTDGVYCAAHASLARGAAPRGGSLGDRKFIRSI